MEKEPEQVGLLAASDDETSSSTEEDPKYETLKNEDSRTVRNTVIAYICVILVLCSYSFATIASQVIGRKTSMFLLNIFRCSAHSLLATFWIVVSNSCIRVAWQDMHKFILATSFEYMKSTLFYIIAAYLPVGNFDGIYGGLLLICSTTIDFFCKEISKLSILVSGIAVIGIIMLTQPWQQESSPAVDVTGEAPCDSMGGFTFSKTKQAIQNATSYDMVNLTHFKDDHGLMHNTSMSTDAESYWVDPLVLAYLMILLAILCSVISGYILRSILQSYTISCVLFWSGVLPTAYSVVIVVFLKLTNSNHLILPTSPPCIGYTVLFLVGAAITAVCINPTYKYLPISKSVISKAFIVVILYIVQRTSLAKFHPGHENIVEVFGIVLVFIASILSPFVSFFCETKRA